MAQELAASLMEERKPSFFHGGLLSDAPSPFSSSTSSSFSIGSFSTTLPPPAPEPPLRCPRCDSPNTKFCYYNNYNLTQPRHFCRTCRRYWTKGGALRNIPIGGGCRKARLGPASSAPTTVAKSCGGGGGSKANKFTPFLDNISLTKIGYETETELMPRPTNWAASPPPSASHLLALLSVCRDGEFQTNATIKEEAISDGPGLGLDTLDQFVDSPWRNEAHIPFVQQQQNYLPLELYQRLRPPAAETTYHSDHWILNNGLVRSSAANSIEARNCCGGVGSGGGSAAPAAHEPVLGAEIGYWNPILPWSDSPPATN